MLDREFVVVNKEIMRKIRNFKKTYPTGVEKNDGENDKKRKEILCVFKSFFVKVM